MDLYYVNADSEEFIEYQKSEDGSVLSEVRRGWHFFSDCKKELSEKVYPDDRDNFLAAMNRKSLMKSLEQKNTFVITYRLTSDNGPVYVSMKISKMDDEQFIIIGISDFIFWNNIVHWAHIFFFKFCTVPFFIYCNKVLF